MVPQHFHKIHKIGTIPQTISQNSQDDRLSGINSAVKQCCFSQTSQNVLKIRIGFANTAKTVWLFEMFVKIVRVLVSVANFVWELSKYCENDTLAKIVQNVGEFGRARNIPKNCARLPQHYRKQMSEFRSESATANIELFTKFENTECFHVQGFAKNAIWNKCGIFDSTGFDSTGGAPLQSSISYA